MVACTGAACNFERDYEIAQAPLMREIERCVRGSERQSSRAAVLRGLLVREIFLTQAFDLAPGRPP